MAYLGNQLCGSDEMWSEDIRKLPILRVSLVGSRGFRNYKLFREFIFNVIKRIKGKYRVIINSGRARGPDRYGERFAKEFGFLCAYFVPDWDKGRGAGFKRNAEMATETNLTVAFWDKVSPGTKGMIGVCKSKGVHVIIKEVQNGFT